MLSRVEQFKARAEECEQRAALARSPKAQAGYHYMAQEWRHLAQQVEWLEREPKPD